MTGCFKQPSCCVYACVYCVCLYLCLTARQGSTTCVWHSRAPCLASFALGETLSVSFSADKDKKHTDCWSSAFGPWRLRVKAYLIVMESFGRLAVDFDCYDVSCVCVRVCVDHFAVKELSHNCTHTFTNANLCTYLFGPRSSKWENKLPWHHNLTC